MKKTKKAYETHLNASYADAYSLSEAIENFCYMTNKSRGKATTIKAIQTAHNNHELGTLLRKYDSIAFYAGFNMWRIPSSLEIK